jgi:hypothetical protein
MITLSPSFFLLRFLEEFLHVLSSLLKLLSSLLLS